MSSLPRFAVSGPGSLIVVATYRPSGETCDMKAARRRPPSLPRKDLHWITSSLRMVVWGRTDTRAYSPLSFCGPSTSTPSVSPSRENEWQLAQVGKPSMSFRLPGWPTLSSRHVM